MGWLNFLRRKKISLHFRKETEYYDVRFTLDRNYEWCKVLKKDFDNFIANINKENVKFYDLKCMNNKLVINSDEVVDINYEPYFEQKYISADTEEEATKIKAKYKRLNYELVK